MNTTQIGKLHSKHGKSVEVNFSNDLFPQAQSDNGYNDCIIIPPEIGFSILSHSFPIITKSLDIKIDVIGEIAKHIWIDNESVAIAGIKSNRKHNKLKGVIIAAHEGSKSYRKYATPRYGKPYRDFYYNVAYESISYAAHTLKAKNIYMPPLSICCNYHEDIAICAIEALGHFIDNNDSAEISSFTFYSGDSIKFEHLKKISRPNNAPKETTHRPIQTTNSTFLNHDLITLKW